MGIVADLKSAFSNPSAGVTPRSASSEDALASTNAVLISFENHYKVYPQNWYTAKPYGFRSVDKYGYGITMFLPISPSNLNISTSFATNIIPTLYGTVEEHSDVRYYDITIEGTTGMTPEFAQPAVSGKGKNNDTASLYQSFRENGRAKFPITNGAPLGGFLSSTLNAAINIKNQIGKIVDVFKTPQTKTGVYTDQTGYVAFHNLYRFLLSYKKDAAGSRSKKKRSQHPLSFFNYKDGTQYDVAIRSFSMKRSAENPMLYYYSISMRGYNLRSAGSQEGIGDDIQQRLRDLGLDGVNPSSLLSKIKSVSSSAKGIVGSVKNGINLAGR